MNFNQLIPVFIVLMALMFLSRMFMEKGLKLLDDSKKAEMYTAFSGSKKLFLIPSIILIGAFMIAISRYPQYSMHISLGFAAVVLLYTGASNLHIYKKLKNIGIPDEYFRYFILSRVIVVAGMCVIVYLMLKDGIPVQ